MRIDRPRARLLLPLLCLAVLPALPARAHPPRASDFEVFASGLDGPEGLAFTRDGYLVVGSITGAIERFAPDGSSTTLATVPDRLAGVTVLSDGRVLATSVVSGQVWVVTAQGDASVFAAGIAGPNFVVETIREGRLLVSASNGNAIVDITDGVPEVVIPDVEFPNGLAIRESGGRRYLYVAMTLASAVVRYRMFDDGSFGEREPYASGLLLADGIGFDAAGNLLCVGGGQLSVVRRTGEVETLFADPPLDWPSNLAFGQGRGFRSRDVYLANFGPTFGDGTEVVKFRYNHRGAPLASAGRREQGCSGRTLSRRTPLRGGAIACPSARSVRRLAVR